MGRRKIEIKAIKDDRNRQVTFLKRKGGLFKKAHELSVLCSVDVAVIIFGHNKKLHEFSSADMGTLLGKYQYFGSAHEHKGPGDFAGKKDVDDDDEDDEMMRSPGPASPEPSVAAAAGPPHPQTQSYLGSQASQASASPPVPNMHTFQPRHSTPQPQGISRPSSRNVRRSSNLSQPHVPATGAQHQTPPQYPPENGYQYGPSPPFYNPQAGAGMSQAPGQPPPQHYPHYTQGPPQPPPPSQQTPPLPPPPASQAGQGQHMYMPEQRRQSMPPSYVADRVPPPEPDDDGSSPPPTHTHEMAMQAMGGSGPATQNQNLPEPKRLHHKSKSIFTPVDQNRSVLARHWGFEPESRDDDQNSLQIPSGSPPQWAGTRSRSADVAHMGRGGPSAPPPPLSGPSHTQPSTMPPPRPITPPREKYVPPAAPMTTDQPAKRPRLKVQIPSEASDAGSATAESSPGDNTTTAAATTAGPTAGGQGGTGGPSGGQGKSEHPDHGHGAVVLPPPSPSASAILSAGATGPPNPFARPNPPRDTGGTGGGQGGQGGGGGGGGGAGAAETPISALPSRYVDNLLPSPSTFYPGWDFGRSNDPNVLPSPLNFQTPVAANGPSFAQREEEGKRKSGGLEGEGEKEEGDAKRVKTES